MAIGEHRKEDGERTIEPGQAIIVAPEPIPVPSARAAGALAPRLVAGAGESAALRSLDFFTGSKHVVKKGQDPGWLARTRPF